MFREICQLIAGDLDNQLNTLSNYQTNRASLIEQYKTSAKKYWNIAIEYKYARKHEWNYVKREKREALSRLTDEELENYQQYYAVSAYEYDRAAARELEAAGNKEKLAEQVDLKKWMALTLYNAGNSLSFEAQIYALAGIYLLVTNDKDNRCKDDFEALEKLLRKIRRSETLLSTASNERVNNVKDKSVLTKAIMAYRQGSITLKQFQSDLLSELRFTILNKNSFRDRKKTELGLSSSSIPSGVDIGISYLIGDVLLGNKFQDANQSNLQHSKIGELITTIINNALHHYNKGQYSEFLYTLTTHYAKPKLLVGIKQIKQGNSCKILLDIRPTVIVEELLSYDFSPEGVANFLVLLGEVLLSEPDLKPKKELTGDIRLELPNYPDFIYFATILFEEVLKNTQLTERAKNIDSKIESRISFVETRCIERLEKSLVDCTYSMPNEYTTERLIVSASVRLEAVKLVTKLNYAIAQMIVGDTESLQKSVQMIKNVKEELMKDLTEEKMFVVSEIRLQALTDIFTTFGYPDDVKYARKKLVFGSKKITGPRSDLFIKNINKVLKDDQTVLQCKLPILFDDNEIDEFELLDKVLNQVLKLNKTQFLKDVCYYYQNYADPLTSLIKKMIRKEKFSNINEWMTSFLQQIKSLNFHYLPILSLLHNLIFIPCTVKSHQEHKFVFVPIKEVIDVSKQQEKVSVYIITEEKNSPEDVRPVKGAFVLSEISLNYIYNQLDSATDKITQSHLVNLIALHYQRQAEKIDKTNHIEALSIWVTAQKYYSHSLTLIPYNLKATLGYATCLVKLGKYHLAEKVLEKKVEKKTYLCDPPEKWLLLGIVKRKLQNYDQAKNAVETALRLKENYVEAKNELNLILKLRQETAAQRIKLYNKMSLIHTEPKSHQYNILSIDGGGIRGLIPAIWISELERRTQLSSSSMFHMMAGTSTGGILAAGLSLPDKPGIIKPRYKAVDFVQLYTVHSKRIFSCSSVLEKILKLGIKYTDEGRKALFEQYFGDTQLSQTLTDLVITATTFRSCTTELFQRSEAINDYRKNYKLVDVLMCTTAAPMYFPSYRLHDTVFVDGGVQANNPAMCAYIEACKKNVKREDIFILSLGTGDYVPDPLNPNAKRHLLFWLTNKRDALSVYLNGPERNIDYQLSNILGSDHYNRWQIWLEKPISLDDISKESLDYLIELARAHFDEMDASDSNNRLGKLIDRFKE
ncbi:unnamed protein product [Rotaria sp. Silwood2]|nr:unnamed protein product [Rotaria sp. Silwood2]CAF2819090.1 unnamed protein product [Rotaria sp. Silwood2]CAF3921633.1 unnamed protein product [Rotaria sp. Silwood2]CAF4069017.1 unnamed protein product [Rotaria sp. Silwood2]